MTAQLVLRFPHTPGAELADLLPNAAQDEARAWLDRGMAWPMRRLALYGAAGVGKSHLARVWAARVGGVVLPVAPETWPGTPIALDDIEAVGNELALLHLMNAAAESGHPLLLVSRRPPGRLPVRLPDLASRLRATTAVEITGADDAFLALLLARLLAERQLRVKPDVQAWLLTRLERTPETVHHAVARLDTASLEAGKTVTQPFAAAALGLKNPTLHSPLGQSPG